jgi:hypothetical protein
LRTISRFPVNKNRMLCYNHICAALPCKYAIKLKTCLNPKCNFGENKLQKNFHTVLGVSELQIVIIAEQGIVKVLQAVVGATVQYRTKTFEFSFKIGNEKKQMQ